MISRSRLFDYLGAASIVVAFSGIFVGRLLNYRVATAGGTFLERLAAQPAVWDWAHRFLVLGLVALIPATLALRRAFHARSPWLADIASAVVILGAALAVGQLALDFAYLAAAQIEPPEAGQALVDRVAQIAFVDWAFYKLPDLAALGQALFALALWRQGPSWRIEAAIISLCVIVLACGPLMHPLAVRATLGVLAIGYAAVAWKIVARPIDSNAARSS